MTSRTLVAIETGSQHELVCVTRVALLGSINEPGVTTVAPSLASAVAIAGPMPAVDPVTRAALLSSCRFICASNEEFQGPRPVNRYPPQNTLRPARRAFGPGWECLVFESGLILLRFRLSKCHPAPLRGLDDRPSSGRAQPPLLWGRCGGRSRSRLLSGCGPSLPLGCGDSGASGGGHVTPSFRRGCTAVCRGWAQHISKLGNLSIDAFLLFFETSNRCGDDFVIKFCRHAN